MTISDYISTIAAKGLPDAHFAYNRNHDFNITGDNIPTDVVLCIEPDQQYLNINSVSGNIYDGYNLFVRFIQTIPAIGIAEQAPSRLAAINQQKINAAQFIAQLNEDDMFIDLPARIPLIPVIESYDGNWFGVEIQLNNLQTIQPFDLCPITDLTPGL